MSLKVKSGKIMENTTKLVKNNPNIIDTGNLVILKNS